MKENLQHLFTFRRIKLHLTIFLGLSFIFLHQSVFASLDETVKTIYFGDNNHIEYFLKTGKYNVYFNNVKVISDAYALAKSTISCSSIDYASRVYTSSSISDGLGSGVKHIISLSGNNLTPMQQIFYVYSGRNYFYTEVALNETGVKSNYMAPLVSENVLLPESGDNRALFVPFDNDTFIKYNALSLVGNISTTSSEVSAIYDNTSRKGLILGSIEHTDWKTGIQIVGSGNKLTALSAFGGFTSQSTTRDMLVHGMVGGSTNTVKSPKILVGYFNDWRDGLEDYGKSNRIAEPPYVFNWNKPTPFGWNSWGSIQSKLSLSSAKAVTDFFSNNLKEFRNDNTAFIDLDSYWDNLNDAQLKEFADYCKSKGLTPGIYWAPFVDWGKSSRTVEGSSYNYTEVWTKVNGAYHDLDGCRAMDPTHPATKKRIEYMIGRFKNAGFQMIKIDFIGHAGIEADSFYDTSVHTGMQAFRKGMEYLIDQLDGKMLVYAAISPNLATGRYVHTRRIACDAFSSIGDTKYSLNSTNYGWWQTYVYNYIDADHLVLNNQSESANRARVASGVITGTVITGDDFSATGQWAGRAQTLFQNQELLDIARNGVAFRPVEGNTGEGTNELFVRKIGNYFYLAAFNYGSTTKAYQIDLKRLGLNSSDSYQVKELFSGSTNTAKTNISFNLEASDARVYRFEVGAAQGQTIDFNPLQQKTFDQPEFEPGATATSGLEVTYTSSNEEVAIVVGGNKIRITGVGTTTITAKQPGNVLWLPAVDVSRPLTITKGNQTIQFSEIPGKTVNSVDFEAGATVNSDLGVTYTSSNTAVATIVNGKIHIIQAGTTTITSSQAGNEFWLAAAPVSQTLTITASFVLPATNFRISAIDESCINSKNGSITITAEANLNYKATITGVDLNEAYTFNNSLNIPSLRAGTFEVCLTVVGQSDFSRCYNIVVKAPQPLSVYSYVNTLDGKLELNLRGGTSYNIELNGVTHKSSTSLVSLDLASGINELSVTTDQDCQGTYKQSIFLENGRVIYPNPFDSYLFVNMGNDPSKVANVSVYSVGGSVVYSKDHQVENGLVQVYLPDMPANTYILKIKTPVSTSSSKILKK